MLAAEAAVRPAFEAVVARAPREAARARPVVVVVPEGQVPAVQPVARELGALAPEVRLGAWVL